MGQLNFTVNIGGGQCTFEHCQAVLKIRANIRVGFHIFPFPSFPKVKSEGYSPKVTATQELCIVHYGRSQKFQ